MTYSMEYLLPKSIPWLDLIFNTERTCEQELAGFLIFVPLETVRAIQKTKIEPLLDKDVCEFWRKLKAILPVIEEDNPEKTHQLIQGLFTFQNNLYWQWKNAADIYKSRFIDENGIDEYIFIEDLLKEIQILREAKPPLTIAQNQRTIESRFRGWL